MFYVIEFWKRMRECTADTVCAVLELLPLRHFKRRARKPESGGKSAEEIFTGYYEQDRWTSAESVSGVGSELEATKNVRYALPIVLKKWNLRSVLDIPCGDFNWMRRVELGHVEYIGADIVEDLVRRNDRKYGSETRTFLKLDILNDRLPAVDLLFCRDLFNHLSFDDIQKALNNIARSKCKYVMFGHYPFVRRNIDIATGASRLLNLEKPPFNFPVPADIIFEDFPGHVEFGRSMALWAIEHMP